MVLLIRWISYVLNVFLIIFFGMVLAAGIHLKKVEYRIDPDVALTDTLSSIIIAFSVISILIALLAVVGCLRLIALPIKIHFWVLFIAVIAQVVLFFISVLRPTTVHEIAKNSALKILQNFPSKDVALEAFVHAIQQRFECCGVISFLDYNQTRTFTCPQERIPQLGPQRFEECSVPISCCKKNRQFIFCSKDVLRSYKNYNNINKIGCLEKVTTTLYAQGFLLTIAFALVMLIQLVVIFSMVHLYSLVLKCDNFIMLGKQYRSDKV